MNKTKKIAIAAVAVVMAGSMAFGMFGCGGGQEDEGDTGLKPTVDADGKLSYTEDTTINVNIIDSGNTSRQISYTSDQIATSWAGLDGKTYQIGDLKPAWQQFGEDLGLTFVDVAKTGRSGSELETAVQQNELSQYNLINASSTQIMGNIGSLLDISKYLDYMPNYKAFLEQNPIVQYSLTMSAGGSMYYIPYFDGNDDIEKYGIVQGSWTEKILDGEKGSNVTFKAQATAKGLSGPSSSATAFMGKTGSWVVETTNPADENDTLYVCLNYDKVIDALEDSSSGLATAVKAAESISGWNANSAGSLTASGNIVDIMNYVINGTAGNVTGSILANILREYIKVAYYYADSATAAATSTSAFYGTTVNSKATKLSDVFMSSYGAWDADLMTAMYRVVVTNYDQFTFMASAKADEVYALAGREGKAQRQNDLISLAGELYGVRGLESRLEYTYIDSEGKLQDARLNEESYDAAAKLNDLAKEGLLYTGSTAVVKYYQEGKIISYMIHDYAQTQTTDGYFTQGIEGVTNASVPEDFNFRPIVTPVSRWDTNDDGTAETVMRFTESWRSVKNTGVVIPLASIGEDSNKLASVLAFVDYLYSNDGQIVGSYGTQASSPTTQDGFWYGKPVTATVGGVSVTNGSGDLAALKNAGVIDTYDGEQYFVTGTYKTSYFMFKNKLYEGIPYNGRQIPIMTDNNMDFYLGLEVNGNKMSTSNTTGIKQSYARSYTNYARGIVGAALPIGNKDQGFEYQCTADCGLNGAAVVNVALQNGTIKHVSQTVDKNNYWYTEAATVLPISPAQGATIGDQVYLDGSSKTVGIYNPTSTSGYSNVYIDLAFYGYNTSIKIGTCGKTEGSYDMKANAAELITYIKGLNSNGLESRLDYYSSAWNTLTALYVK